VAAAELAQVLLDKERNKNATQWADLRPVEAKSVLGTTLSILPDDSILASGANPLKERYCVELTVGTAIDLAAVRLEALTHPSLPGSGPGRNPSGAFSQTSWSVTATSPDRVEPIKVEFDTAWADHQSEWGPIKADGQWDIWGGQGGNCTAIWSMAKSISLAPGTKLAFEMQYTGSEIRGNLGRFRLSVSGDQAVFARERTRLAARKLADPWSRLAAAYQVIGDHQALDKLLDRHPAAAAGVGDLYGAAQDWERAIAEYHKTLTDQPSNRDLFNKLATAYQSAGRTREAVRCLAKIHIANPQDSVLLLKLASLQAWFQQDSEWADTCRRALTSAGEVKLPQVAQKMAKACCLLPSVNKAQVEAALALARKAVELGKTSPWLAWFQMALGMAEYRSGRFAEADARLLAAANGGISSPSVVLTAAFYRALSLYRQGKENEARQLATEAAVKMKPLPKDEANPLAGGKDADDLILWLAYKEAKAMIKFDAAPAAPATPVGK
jgi:tetratricopeptide (TPR) repeat protein